MATIPSDDSVPPSGTSAEGTYRTSTVPSDDILPPSGTEFSPAGMNVGGSKSGETPSVASAAAQLFKDGAAKLGKEAADRARGYVDDGKARAGGALDEFAQMMTDAAGTVDQKLGEQYGQYARTAAEKVSGFSESLKAKQLDDLIEDAREFVHKSPAIAIGTAAALGFVLVRLIQSGLAADRDEA